MDTEDYNMWFGSTWIVHLTVKIVTPSQHVAATHVCLISVDIYALYLSQ